MSETTSRIRRLGVELFVIVLGVLIALGADSWWSERAERESVRAYLEAISQDFAQAEVGLEEAISGLREQVGAIQAFIELADPAVPIPDGTSLPSLGGEAGRFFPPTGMLDAIVATGDIKMVRRDVRAVLIREQSEITRRGEQIDRFSDLIVDAVRDLSLPISEARLSGVDMNGGSMAGVILTNPQALTGLTRMQTGWANQLAEYTRMLESVRTVRSTIDEALAAGDWYARR